MKGEPGEPLFLALAEGFGTVSIRFPGFFIVPPGMGAEHRGGRAKVAVDMFGVFFRDFGHNDAAGAARGWETS